MTTATSKNETFYKNSYTYRGWSNHYIQQSYSVKLFNRLHLLVDITYILTWHPYVNTKVTKWHTYPTSLTYRVGGRRFRLDRLCGMMYLAVVSVHRSECEDDKTLTTRILSVLDTSSTTYSRGAGSDIILCSRRALPTPTSGLTSKTDG